MYLCARKHTPRDRRTHTHTHKYTHTFTHTYKNTHKYTHTFIHNVVIIQAPATSHYVNQYQNMHYWCIIDAAPLKVVINNLHLHDQMVFDVANDCINRVQISASITLQHGNFYTFDTIVIDRVYCRCT